MRFNFFAVASVFVFSFFTFGFLFCEPPIKETKIVSLGKDRPVELSGSALERVERFDDLIEDAKKERDGLKKDSLYGKDSKENFVRQGDVADFEKKIPWLERQREHEVIDAETRDLSSEKDLYYTSRKSLNRWWSEMVADRVKRFQREIFEIRKIHGKERNDKRKVARLKFKAEEDIGLIDDVEQREEVARAATDTLIEDGTLKIFQEDIDKLQGKYQEDLAYFSDQWQQRIDELDAASSDDDIHKVLEEADDWRSNVKDREARRLNEFSRVGKLVGLPRWVEKLRNAIPLPIPKRPEIPEVMTKPVTRETILGHADGINKSWDKFNSLSKELPPLPDRSMELIEKKEPPRLSSLLSEKEDIEEPRPAEPQLVEPQPAEQQPAEPKSAEPQLVEPKSVEPQLEDPPLPPLRSPSVRNKVDKNAPSHMSATKSLMVGREAKTFPPKIDEPKKEPVLPAIEDEKLEEKFPGLPAYSEIDNFVNKGPQKREIDSFVNQGPQEREIDSFVDQGPQEREIDGFVPEEDFLSEQLPPMLPQNLDFPSFGEELPPVPESVLELEFPKMPQAEEEFAPMEFPEQLPMMMSPELAVPTPEVPELSPAFLPNEKPMMPPPMPPMLPQGSGGIAG
ncbi:hypothetical protein HOD08_02670 [bacterium]|nr:hypothetical protein [bacterium]